MRRDRGSLIIFCPFLGCLCQPDLNMIATRIKKTSSNLYDYKWKKIFFSSRNTKFIYFSPHSFMPFFLSPPYSGLVLGSTRVILSRKETSFLWNQPIFSVWLCWIVRQCYLLFLSLPLTLIQNSNSQCCNVQEQWKAKHFFFLPF